MMRTGTALAAMMALGACQSIGGPIPDRTFQTRPASTTTSTSASAATTSTQTTVAAAPARDPEQVLLDAERALAGDVQTRGLGPALASALDYTDGFAVRSGNIYQGPDAVQNGLATPANIGPVFWQADRAFVSTAGDMGMTSGRYAQILEGREAIQGRYVIVWRKDAAGNWRVLSETRTADPPTPPPAAPAPTRRRR
ncbi:MAG: hypothetical protein GC189_01265 [Alphaproteobacteria bacterium]|nr:hypothetical protein [Alphaproteobacteria bacterium]